MKTKYMYIGIEVSTQCNARCPWCFTTKISEKEKSGQGKRAMSIDSFILVIERLEALGLLHDDVLLNLYEIGEPFLNKDIVKIFRYLNGKSIKYAISTNASLTLSFENDPDALKNLSSLLISIPGFSQESYNRVHGFEFDRIKNNIVKLLSDFRKNGFAGDARLIYHVYQFNLNEIQRALAFAEENNIDFYPYYATLYEWQYVRDYIDGTLPYDLLRKASGELFLGNIQKTIDSRPSGFSCNFFDMLLVDINGDLKTCCQIRKGAPNYSYGNIFDIAPDEIRRARTTQQICRECQSKGMDYYLSVYTPFDLNVLRPGSPSGSGGPEGEVLKFLTENTGGEIVLFGAGEFGMKALSYLKGKNVKVSFFSDNSALKIGRQFCGLQVIEPGSILKRCANPRVIITTVNHKQVANQLCQLGVKSVHYAPINMYGS